MNTDAIRTALQIGLEIAESCDAPQTDVETIKGALASLDVPPAPAGDTAAPTDDEILNIAKTWVKAPGWFEFERNDFLGCVRNIRAAAPAAPAQPVTCVRALRQIIEADDAQALTSQLIEIGRAALAAAPVAEPAWFEVDSKEAPIVRKAIKSEEIAEEYAQKCRDNGYRGVEVHPLYRAPSSHVPTPHIPEN